MTKRTRIWLLGAGLAGMLGLAGCAGQGSPVAAPSPEAAPARLENGIYHDDRQGVFWLGPVGWRPLAGEGEVAMGWEKPAERLVAQYRPLAAGEGSLAEQAGRLAAARGWRLERSREVTWLGTPAVDAVCEAGSQKLRARLLARGPVLFLVTAQAPAAAFAAKQAELADAMDRFRLIPAADLLHVVKRKSETLALVSLWYTGSAGNWPRLQKHNQLVGSRLVPGMEILVPRELLWRQDPLPPWAGRLGEPVAALAAPAPPARGKAARPAAEEEDGELDELTPTGPK